MSLIVSAALRALRFFVLSFLVFTSFVVVRHLLEGDLAAHPVNYWLGTLEISAEFAAYMGLVSFIYFRWLEAKSKR